MALGNRSLGFGAWGLGLNLGQGDSENSAGLGIPESFWFGV